MSVDTCARLYGHVFPVDIIKFLQDKFNVTNVSVNVEEHNYGYFENKKEWINNSGMIYFRYMPEGKTDSSEAEIRSIFYSKSNINFHENLEMYTELGLENMVNSETTYISMGAWGHSVEIMKAICEHFSGWLLEQDGLAAEEKPYYWIPKNHEAEPNKVRRITMQEVYDKFGEYVVITDR